MDTLHRIKLSESDLRFVVETVADRREDHDRVVEIVRDKPDILDQMLDDEKLFRRLTLDQDAIVRVSPWLLFDVLLRRAAIEMPRQRFTVERLGSNERIPVFDAEKVASLLRNRVVRDYLAELLASFVRTNSTMVYYRSGRRYRRRTFSDMDVDDMIALSGSVAADYRFSAFRHIGDLCLFVAGVFPEHLLPGYGAAPPQAADVRWGRHRRTLEEYQNEAERFYGLAAAHPDALRGGLREVLATLADNFGLARKPLNYITDRYIKIHRENLFGSST
ncbi:MAG: hypothetical protein ACYC3S_06030 [Chloroflexota bacterium]